MGIMEDVQGLQGTIVARTGTIFDQLSSIATSASNSALGVNLDEPTVHLPTVPTINIALGTVTFSDDTYVSALYNALSAVLVKEINSGGYGLDPNDEARLFEAARDRENEASASAVEDSTRLFAAGGFSIPTGASAAARYRAQSESRDKLSAINRDILSKKADLYLTAKGQTISAANQLEQVLEGSFSAKQERKLKAAVQNLTSAIEAAVAGGNITLAGVKAAIDAALGEANLKLEAAKAKANVFASLAASSMSGLHVNASLAAGADAQESFHGQISESTTYDHNYQEK